MTEPAEPYDPWAILADPGAHPIHVMYAEINLRVAVLGEVWAKCIGCGCPYEVTEDWPNADVCSPSCEAIVHSSILASPPLPLLPGPWDVLEPDRREPLIPPAEDD